MILTVIPTFPHNKRVVALTLLVSVIVLVILHRLHRFLRCGILILQTSQWFVNDLSIHCKFIRVLRYHRLVDHLLFYQLIYFILILILVNFILGHRKGRDDLPLLRRSLLVSYHLAVRVHG
jgi:hypothetical protein